LICFYCETPILKAQRSEMGKLNNPAQQRVVRSKFQKHSALKLADRTILPMHGYNTPQLAAELGSRACPGVHTCDFFDLVRLVPFKSLF
jgi:hypothetical protein